MTFADYDTLSPDDKEKFERNTTAKLSLYTDFANDHDIWQKMAADSDPIDDVYAMKLSDLP